MQALRRVRRHIIQQTLTLNIHFVQMFGPSIMIIYNSTWSILIQYISFVKNFMKNRQVDITAQRITKQFHEFEVRAF